jgi:transposase-like protein
LQQRGIIHAVRRCANNHVMTLMLTDRQDRWRCWQGIGLEDIPLRRGTWLQDSRLTYRQIILFIYCWSKEMTSISFCENELEIGKNAVIDWNNYLREVCANILITNPIVIGGPNTTVEIDESLFTRRKNHMGRVLPQQWVFGGLCCETDEVFMFTVPDRSAATLIPIIMNHIRPGTTVISDRWQAYNTIATVGQGYVHRTVNHSLHFVDPNTGANTQRIERSWKTAKERNKRHNGTHRNMLDSYMCEFMWRRRASRLHLNTFDAILQDIVVFWPPA